MTPINSEEIFDKTMLDIAPELSYFKNYDLIIGIPFIDEGEQLAELLKSIDRVLKTWLGKRQLIVCVGDYSAKSTLEIISNLSLQHPHIQFLLPPEISGRGTSVRAIIEISKRLDADLLLFSAKMATEKGPGIEDNWLDSLLTPIQGPYDLVLGSLRRHTGIDSIAHMLAAPILESFYGFRAGDPLGGIYAISHDFTEELAHEARFWGDTIQGAGIDFWILTRALTWNKHICEVSMGGRISPHRLEVRNRIFADNALTVFEALKRDSAIWLQERLVIKVADILARSEIKRPDVISYSIKQLRENFIRGYHEHLHVFNGFAGQEQIEDLTSTTAQDMHMQDELWISAMFFLFLNYAFNTEDADKLEKTDYLKALTALYNGRIASYVLEMREFSDSVFCATEAERDEYLVRKMESVKQALTNHFWQMKPEFTRQWLIKNEQMRPPIIPLGYMEYVPGRPIVVPKKIVGKDGRIVNTDNIFKELRKRYENKFNQIVVEGLGLQTDADADKIITAVKVFMKRLEEGINSMLPGDLTTEKGLRQFVDSLMKFFGPRKMYTINSDLLREMLIRFPPVNLMIPLGYYRPDQLIDSMDTRDAVSYANLVESASYTDRDLNWLMENVNPESFAWVDIKALLLTDEHFPARLPPGKISNFNLITGRILIRPLEKGEGGDYPKLRYFTNLVRRLAIAEHYSQLFTLNAMERKNIGLKAKNSLLSMRKGELFSAHNIFENYHHRLLVEKIHAMAEIQQSSGNNALGALFKLMANSYGIGQMLENEIFLTCTAWSWASYSFKGGVNIPTPLTTTVESRWFNHDFLEMLYEELGYDRDEILQIVFRLIQTGKSDHNLLDTLLPSHPKDVAVVVQETTNEPSRHLRRYENNPILEPVSGSRWESKYVLNPGALRIEDKVYLFYRAVGEDDISHIGLAVTDGYKVLERLSEPVFSPQIPEEKMGCEDPRLIIIGERVFMLYTAYDGNIAQIAAASIEVEDIKAGRYLNWKREGLAFKNIWDKDAILFPEKINGRYVIYHRIEPSIWVTYMKEVKFPLTENHAIIVGPRPGRMWDSLKIGAGAQPLKTKYGWLLIYHGVDYNYVYRLGVLLVDLNNPQKIIYRSPNPVLEPEEDYEVGLDGAWVPNVVFTCGAVAATDKEILEDDDEILVYYGAADTSIGLATATVKDLIPDSFRK